MDYIEKKNQVLKSLKKHGLDEVFTKVDSINDNVLIKGIQSIGANEDDCLIMLALNDSVYNHIFYNLGLLDDVDDRELVMELFNKFNAEDEMLKFYLENTKEGQSRMIARAYYFTPNDEFNSEEYILAFLGSYKRLHEIYYDILMEYLYE